MFSGRRVLVVERGVPAARLRIVHRRVREEGGCLVGRLGPGRTVVATALGVDQALRMITPETAGVGEYDLHSIDWIVESLKRDQDSEFLLARDGIPEYSRRTLVPVVPVVPPAPSTPPKTPPETPRRSLTPPQSCRKRVRRREEVVERDVEEPGARKLRLAIPLSPLTPHERGGRRQEVFSPLRRRLEEVRSRSALVAGNLITRSPSMSPSDSQ